MSETKQLNYASAVNTALRRVLQELPEVLVFGEDVGKPGGVFGVTRGLRRSFGDRVFDMMGRRPIVEIMWADFALVAFDQIVNQIANTRYVSRGLLGAPLVIRTQQGSGPGACAQHSQSLEALFLHIPGIRVAIPSTPQDAYEAIVAATYSDDPVVVIENRNIYHGEKVDVIVDRPAGPLGGSHTRRSGDDLTVVTWGSMTRVVETAADMSGRDGIAVDVIELHWLNPLDLTAVLASLARTGKLMLVHEANVTGGFGSEVIARVAEGGTRLSAPPVRLGLPDLRVPAAPTLARAVVPSADSVREAIGALHSSGLR